MYHVKNMTNSPHKIRLADGTDGRIPARGDGEFDIHPDYVKPLIMSGYLRVTPTDSGSEDQDGDDLEALRTEYLELTGKPADKRWKEARVRAEIDKALAE